jgi:hypothetical protein
VITWKDFILDERFGALLIEDAPTQMSVEAVPERPSVMEDASGDSIQETGHRQQPARMVGSTGLGSEVPKEAPVGMDAGRGERVLSQGQQRKGA